MYSVIYFGSVAENETTFKREHDMVTDGHVFLSHA